MKINTCVKFHKNGFTNTMYAQLKLVTQMPTQCKRHESSDFLKTKQTKRPTYKQKKTINITDASLNLFKCFLLVQGFALSKLKQSIGM